MSIVRPPDDGAYTWRAAADQDVVRYCEDDGGGNAVRARSAQVYAHISVLLARPGGVGPALRIAEIGCGDGTSCRLWAERGHHVHGVERDSGLVMLARKRVARAGLEVAFDVAEPGALPWPSRSMDVCIAHGLPGQAQDVRAALSELVRVLKPGGALYLSTTNGLDPCPAAETGQRAAAARVSNCLTYYRLREVLRRHGLETRDRLDIAWYASRRPLVRAVLRLLRALPPLRWLGQLASPRTVLVAVKPVRSVD